MKLIVIILFLCNSVKAQQLDTIPELIPVIDFTSKYNVYDKTGRLVRVVTDYQNANVPVGGWKSEQQFVNNQKLWLKGYTVYTTDTANVMTAIQFLGMNKLPIPSPYRVCGVTIPISGLNLKF